MKLNYDCIRAILLTLESYPYDYECDIDQLYSDIPKFSKEEIQYCTCKLYDINYIEGFVFTADGCSPYVSSISDITFAGHEFLNSIREPEIWKKTKNIASEIGAISISTISQIASGIFKELIFKYFNF